VTTAMYTRTGEDRPRGYQQSVTHKGTDRGGHFQRTIGPTTFFRNVLEGVVPPPTEGGRGRHKKMWRGVGAPQNPEAMGGTPSPLHDRSTPPPSGYGGGSPLFRRMLHANIGSRQWNEGGVVPPLTERGGGTPPGENKNL
jgi:hypothetical protein